MSRFSPFLRLIESVLSFYLSLTAIKTGGSSITGMRTGLGPSLSLSFSLSLLLLHRTTALQTNKYPLSFLVLSLPFLSVSLPFLSVSLSISSNTRCYLVLSLSIGENVISLLLHFSFRSSFQDWDGRR